MEQKNARIPLNARNYWDTKKIQKKKSRPLKIGVMNNFKFGTSSNRVLRTVEEPLQRVVRVALSLTDVDFSVIEGIRDRERQADLVYQGLSWTMDSKHLRGRAIDLYPWVDGATSHNPEHYKRVAKAMFAAAFQVNVPIEWGGFWRASNQDMPHWEMPD